MTAIPFKKCVDSSAVVVISTLIKGLEPAQKLQLPKAVRTKPASESLLDTECDQTEVFDEGDRAVFTEQRSPGIKGALAHMNNVRSPSMQLLERVCATSRAKDIPLMVTDLVHVSTVKPKAKTNFAQLLKPPIKDQSC